MSNPTPAAARAASPGRGIALALVAFAMFTVMDTGVKALGASWHVAQVMAVNSGVAVILVTVIAAVRGGLGRLGTRQVRLHLLRWAISFVGTIAVFSAYPKVPLADAYGVLFTMPLFLTALSVPLLNEPVGWRRWSAVGVGFVGVLVMLQPGGQPPSPWLFATLFGAVCHALNMILIRKLGTHDAPESVSFWGNLLTAIACGLTLPWLGTWPSPTEAVVGLGIGTIAGTAFLLLVTAYQAAPAGIIAPFQYSQLLYGTLAGWLVFGEIPGWRTLAGAVLVVASGLYILHRETVRRRPTVAASPARTVP